MNRLKLALAFIAFASLVPVAGAQAITCGGPDAQIPIYLKRKPTDPRDVVLSTNPAAGDAAGYTDGSVAFNAMPLTAGACELGARRVLALVNTRNGRHFYTTDPAEATARKADPMDPGWADDAALDACIAQADDQSCEAAIPMFRLTDRSPMPADNYTTTYSTTVREHLDCTLKGGACTPRTLGRVWPVPQAYAVRNFKEAYVPLRTGTRIRKQADGDDEATTLPLPFPFMFYGKAHTVVKVTTNGLLTFNPPAADAADIAFRNAALPQRDAPQNFIAGWWDDSLLIDDTEFLYTTEGAAPNRRFVVQWGKGAWTHLDRRDVRREMQIALYEGSNRIEVHYGPHGFDTTKGTSGETASVGIEDPGATDGSRTALACTPNCDNRDWTPDRVIAFIPEPRGYVVREVRARDPKDMTDPDAYRPLAMGDPGVAAVTASPMDAQFVDLGFSFTFDGQRFTRVGISTSGALMFDRLPPYDTMTTPADIPPAPADRGRSTNTIAPWWTQGFVDTSKGSDNLLFRRSGGAGNHVFTVEWKNLTHFTKTVGPMTFVDPTSRQVQVQLHEADSSVVIYYADTTFKPFAKSFDAATAGIINADGDGATVSYRLLNCTPKCMEARRDRDGLDRDEALAFGDWPRYTKFVFTPDPQPGPAWHAIYRQYLMADAFAPAGPSSAGHCGNCHVYNFRKDEDELYDALFDETLKFPAPDTTTCWYSDVDKTVWMKSPTLARSGGVVDNHSHLVSPAETAVTWMTEPGGGYNAVEANMPFDTYCLRGHRGPAQMNDEAKSRIRRWVLQNTP